METNNKLREALDDIIGIAKIALNVNSFGNSNNSELWRIIDKCESALSAPQKNCEVGTLPHPPSWVVVGCESGPNRRPCKIEWVESIVEQCLAANVPVFVKQLDIGGKCVTDIGKFPGHLRIRQVPWAKEGAK